MLRRSGFGSALRRSSRPNQGTTTRSGKEGGEDSPKKSFELRSPQNRVVGRTRPTTALESPFPSEPFEINRCWTDLPDEGFGTPYVRTTRLSLFSHCRWFCCGCDKKTTRSPVRCASEQVSSSSSILPHQKSDNSLHGLARRTHIFNQEATRTHPLRGQPGKPHTSTTKAQYLSITSSRA